jgi:lysozyme
LGKNFSIKKVESSIPLQIVSKGIELIKEFEGCSLYAYNDPLTGGLPITIGWGSTKSLTGKPLKLGDKLTQNEADLLLLQHLKTEFLPILKNIPYWNEMNEEMQSALLSFSYNLGAVFYGCSGFNTITKLLAEKKWNEIPEALKLYRNPGTSVELGLLRRRTAEGKLWEEGLKKYFNK